MQRSIRIEILGDLAAHGCGLNATCERCRRRTDLDLLALSERLGRTTSGGMLWHERLSEGDRELMQTLADALGAALCALATTRTAGKTWLVRIKGTVIHEDARGRHVAAPPGQYVVSEAEAGDYLVTGEGRPAFKLTP